MKTFRDFTMTEWWFYICLTIIATLIAYGASAQTKEEVWNYIQATDLKHKEIVYKQVLKETRHLTCTNCSLDHNNLFGFRYNHEYLKFKSWRWSIIYYVGWQERKGCSRYENYFDFLRDEWGAPDMDHYIRTLKQIRL